MTEGIDISGIEKRLDRIIELLRIVADRDGGLITFRLDDASVTGDWLMCPDCGRLVPPGACCDCE